MDPCTTLEEMINEMINHDREEATQGSISKAQKDSKWWDQIRMTMRLIKQNDRFFIAGASGMAGSAIVRALQRSGYGDR